MYRPIHISLYIINIRLTVYTCPLCIRTGPWSPRKVPNPEFFEDLIPALTLAPIGALAIEVWTTNKGILYDNFYIGYSLDDAIAFAKTTFEPKVLAEEAAAKAAKKEAAKQAKAQQPPLTPESLLARVKEFSEEFVEGLSAFATEQPYSLAAAAVVLLLSIVYLLLPSGARHSSRSASTTDEDAALKSQVGPATSSNEVEKEEEESKEHSKDD